MNFISQKQITSLQGVAIGDALGLPIEAHTRKQILGLLNREYLGAHNGLVDTYYPIGRHAMYRPYIASGEYPFLRSSATGICSDDTLLTIVIMESLRGRGGVDIDDIITRHIESVLEEPFGFGKGTRTTMEAIARGRDWRVSREKSFGNGVMMKQSPFAFFQAETQKDMVEDLITLAQITHAHPVSLVASKLHHKLLIDIILSHSDHFDMSYWLQEGVKLAKGCEKEYGAPPQVSSLLRDIKNEKSEKLSLEDIANRYVRKIEIEPNPYFNILSTLGIVYAIFLRQQDFRAIQQGASIGGDTDSYASILGSMVGALEGSHFEKSYIEGLHPRYREKLNTVLR